MLKFELAESLFDSDDRVIPFTQSRDFEYQTSNHEFEFFQALPSSLVFLRQRPAEESLSTIYPPYYEPYHFDQLPWLVRLIRDFVQRSKVKFLAQILSGDATMKRVIDVGCGNGKLLKLVKRFGEKNWDLHANEMNQQICAHLEREGFTVHSESVFQIAKRDYFDVVILNQVIEHFSSPRELLRSCRQLLCPKGYLVLETPSIDGWDSKLFSNRYWGGYHTPRHFYLFNKANLCQLLAEEKFRVLNVKYLLSPAFWVQSVHHWISESSWRRFTGFFTIKNPLVLAFAVVAGAIELLLTKKSSNMRVLCQKI